MSEPVSSSTESGRELFPSDETIQRAIAMLRQYERETRRDSRQPPPNWPDGKDGNATEAIRMAACLMRQMVGWAIDHKVGLAMANQPPAPPAVGVPDPDPQRLEKERAASEDSHEERGRSYEYGDAEQDRRVLASLLRLMTPAFPAGLATDASYSLIGLEMGDTSGLLERHAAWKNQPALRLELLKRWAVSHLEYQRGCGTKRTAAKAEIATAYKISEDQIETWATDAKQGVNKALDGLMDIEGVRWQAKDAGRRVQLWKRARDGQDNRADAHEAKAVAFFEAQYGSVSLKSHGKEYRDLGRKKAKRTHLLRR